MRLFDPSRRRINASDRAAEQAKKIGSYSSVIQKSVMQVEMLLNNLALSSNHWRPVQMDCRARLKKWVKSTTVVAEVRDQID